MGHLPQQVSVTFTTWIASLFAGVWRVMLTPLDTCKTVLQVEGPKGFASLMKKVSATTADKSTTSFFSVNWIESSGFQNMDTLYGVYFITLIFFQPILLDV